MTSIEWFMEKIGEKQPNGFYVIDTLEDVENVFNKAKEMHKQEMIKFANDFWNWAKGGNFDTSDAEQYYQETFKKD